MANIDDKILSKIKKCMALSQSAEPHEAAAALRQAQKLMEAHGISQIDLGRSDIGEATVKSKVSVSRIKDWELRLVKLVAGAFGCQLLWTKSNSYRDDVYGQFTLIGLKTQLELAQYTCDVMQRKLVKARGIFVQSLPTYMDRGYKTVEADGFCHGWVMAVSKTIHEFAVGEEVERLIAEVVKEQSGGRESKVQERHIGQHGLNAGREAGASESIHRPVGNSPRLQLGGK